jgi:hypothetical protein
LDDRGLKKILAIVIDVLFVAIIVLAVYLLTVNNFISINENVLYAVIILLIPVGFYMTYMSFAKEIDWNKLPGDKDVDDDESENDDKNENEAETETSTGTEAEIKSAANSITGGSEENGNV